MLCLTDLVIQNRVPGTTLVVLQLDQARTAEFRKLLDRALNTVPHGEWPQWVQRLGQDIDAALERFRDETMQPG